MRVTHALVNIAAALMAAPEEQHWGYKLSQTAGVLSGALYPRLATMVEEGWLVDGRQSLEEAGSRPPRRYYSVTDKGKAELEALLAKARKDRRFQSSLL